MAKIFPELTESQLDDLNSKAEATLYRKLRESLNDTYLILFEPKWILKTESSQARDGETDFLIAHPKYGFFCLEVKGGGLRTENDLWFSQDRNGQEHTIKNPFKQALNAKYAIKSKLKESKKFSSDLQTISTGHAVFFPDVNSARAFVRPDAPIEIIGTFTELQELERWIEGVFRYWQGPQSSSLGSNGVAKLREVLARPVSSEISLAASMATLEAKRIILTQNQLQILDFLSSHRRVAIRGGAGTGKTVIAIEKAKRLAQEGFKTLLTCYNRPLSNWIATQVKDIPNLTVSNFDRVSDHFVDIADQKLGKDCLAQARATYPNGDLWQVLMPAAMTFALEYVDERFDAIVVDEAQDFPEEYWFPLEFLLSDFTKSPLYIFFDSHQNLYSRKLNFPEMETPFDLSKNCRNTKQIHEFAYKNYNGPIVNPPNLDGNAVQIFTYQNIDQQFLKISQTIVDLLAKKAINPEQITVLIGDSFSKHEKYQRLLTLSLPNHVNWSIENGQKIGSILVDTVKRFKGLESDYIIIWGLPTLESGERTEVIYVGSTRAKSELVLVCAKD